MQEAATAYARVKHASRLAICAALAFTTATGCRSTPVQIAPPPPPPTAAVAAVRQAKKVFVLNGGADGDFLRGYPYGGNVCYAEFYTSLQQSGRFQLVGDPKQADLVLMVEGVWLYDSELAYGRRGVHTEEVPENPQVLLNLIDVGSQQTLYTLRKAMKLQNKEAMNKLALATAINDLTEQLFTMKGESPTLPSPASLTQATAPVPPAVLTGKHLYVMVNADATVKSSDKAVFLAAFVDTLKASNRFILLPSQKGADLVLETQWSSSHGLLIRDAATMQLLWTASDAIKSYPGHGKTLLRNDAAGTAGVFLGLSTVR